MKRQSYFNQLLNAPAASSAPVLRPPRLLFRANIGSADLQMPATTGHPPVRPSTDRPSPDRHRAGPAPETPHVAQDQPQSEAAPILEIVPATVEPKREQAPWPMPAVSGDPVIAHETVAPEPSSRREAPQRAQSRSETQSRLAAIERGPADRPAMAEPAAARRQTIAFAEPGSGLRIGTLEVRVSAPPVASAPMKTPKPPAPPQRAAPQPIARPFPAFGLRQS